MTRTPRSRFETSRLLVLSLVAVSVCLVSTLPADAQPQPAPNPRAQSQRAPRGPEIAPPQHVTLPTKDGVSIRATYYKPTLPPNDDAAGTKVVPIILLHGLGGKRGEYHHVALFLQQQGRAVIVPDLRAHGESTYSRRRGSSDQTVRPDSLDRNDVLAIIRQDMEAVKKFLLDEHNKKQLNIELLCVLAADEMAAVALNWVVLDWSWRQLPTLKQGQDVKAVVLLSPQASLSGVTTQMAMRHPFVLGGRMPISLSALIVVGRNDSSSAAEADRLYRAMTRYREEPSPEERREKQEVFLVELDTSLKGTQLLNARGLNVPQLIDQFLQVRLIGQMDRFPPWQPRTNPYGQ